MIVNTLIFYFLSLASMGELWANTIAFFLAVQFAYFANTRYVFREPFTWRNFFRFWGMRIGTLFIDNGGIWLLLLWGWHSLLAKCIVNGICIILNYLFSKFIIYRKRGNFK